MYFPWVEFLEVTQALCTLSREQLSICFTFLSIVALSFDPSPFCHIVSFLPKATSVVAWTGNLQPHWPCPTGVRLWTRMAGVTLLQSERSIVNNSTGSPEWFHKAVVFGSGTELGVLPQGSPYANTVARTALKHWSEPDTFDTSLLTTGKTVPPSWYQVEGSSGWLPLYPLMDLLLSWSLSLVIIQGTLSPAVLTHHFPGISINSASSIFPRTRNSY